MTEKEIGQLLARQRDSFATGATLPAEARLRALQALDRAIRGQEPALAKALKTDLGKGRMESYMCEIGLTLSELSWMQKHLRGLMRERRVPTPLGQFAARSFRSPAPYGNVLVMSPWNYPVLLTLEPLIDALAAGNTVLVKPSAYAPATAEVLKRLLQGCFAPELVAVVTGGRAENQALLQQKFDKIFFTGSKEVGKTVLRAAAEHLTPATLELGGKSPCIVEGSANISLAAKRIVFGKFLNCGQTCVAPDYVLCEQSVQPALLAAIQKEITAQFGARPLENKNYGKIINQKHFDRILGLIDAKKLLCGGESDAAALRIAPTVLQNVSWDDAVMGEEIFGPVLPVLTVPDMAAAIEQVNAHAHPLALYLFTEDKAVQRRVLARCRFGGGCVNDVVIHLATSAMPFGGVGESGMGAYHGRAGFEEFSHLRSIVDKKTWMDLPIRYQPYTAGRETLMRLFLR